MERSCLLAFAVAVIVSTATAQSRPPSSGPDALDLLNRVAQRYTDAKTYSIEATEEDVSSSGELSRSWQKTILKAAEDPGKRHCYFEGRAFSGSALRISDGTTTWKYHVDENRYTAIPAANEKERTITYMPEIALMEAERLKKDLNSITAHLQSAHFLPDSVLTIDGREVHCYVVHVQSSDEKRARPDFYYEKTIWIDKAQLSVLKTFTKSDGHYFMGGGVRGPHHRETTIIYTTQLNQTLPDSRFSFTPPADAKLVPEFADPTKEQSVSEWIGKSAPPLKFKSGDNKVAALEDFRGKPVLIDFWATWCAPCVRSLQEMSKLYDETKDRGLVMLSVDQDEDPKAATGLLAKNGYTWPNFHDNGEIEKLMHTSGIPRVVLIDRDGKIAFDKTGVEGDELRTAISKLGPEFQSIAPAPKKKNPCSEVQ